MKKNTFKHSCSMLAAGGGKDRASGKGKRTQGRKTDKKAVEMIFNKFYKNQVAELYRSIRDY